MKTKRFKLNRNKDRIWGHLHTLIEKPEIDHSGRAVISRSGREKMIPIGTPVYNKDGTPMMGWIEEWIEEGYSGTDYTSKLF